MAVKPGKLGKVTFTDPTTGAFVEDLSDKAAAPAKVFVPADLIKSKALTLKEGELVEFEEENNTAVEIKPLK